MNSPRSKKIFVGIFSYRLILDVMLQNYRRTIWNGGQYGMAYPFLIVRPCHIVPPLNCISLWINKTSAWVVWRKSKRSWVQEDLEKIYKAHSRCRPIPCCAKRYLGTTCLDMTLASVAWTKTLGIVHGHPQKQTDICWNLQLQANLGCCITKLQADNLEWGTIRHGLPISYCPPMPYCPTSKLYKFVDQ